MAAATVSGATVNLNNFDPVSMFTNGAPPHMVGARGFTAGTPGTTIYVTNFFAQSAVVTNAVIQNLYVTQQIVSSNSASGNIQGTVGYVALFGPDTFSVAPSSLEQTDTNTLVLHGTGDAQLTLNGTLPQIVWGTGGTNILYRSASSLVYAVGGHDLLTVLPNGAFQTALRGNDNTGVFLTSNNLVPEVDDGTSLGGNGVSSWWHNLGLKGSEWISGFLSGTNYSRVEMKHTGTNGVVALDSQSLGTAGPPRPIAFEFGGTNLLQVAPDLFTPGVVSISNPTLEYLTIGDGTASTVQITESPTDNVFFGAGGTISLQCGADPGDPFGGRRIQVFNNQSASAGTQQPSPSIEWSGAGWASGAGSTKATDFASFVQPFAGTTPVAWLQFLSSIQSSGNATNLIVSSEGPIILRGITKAEKTAIAQLKEGMIVLQTDNTPGLRAYYGGAWHLLVDAPDP